VEEEAGACAGAHAARPRVGAQVRLVRDSESSADMCLGKVAEGKRGKLLKDDGTRRPFLVVCEGERGWFAERDIEEA
jgi:hypothetical protein